MFFHCTSLLDIDYEHSLIGDYIGFTLRAVYIVNVFIIFFHCFVPMSLSIFEGKRLKRQDLSSN